MTEYTDEDVANILKSEAAQKNLRGTQSNRAGAIKPNTRFLQNLLKDTQSHNAALLAKEKREARARQDQLHQEERESRRGEDERSSKRRRLSGDYHDRREKTRSRKGRSRSRSHSRSPTSSRRRRESSKDRERRHRHRSVDDKERRRRSGHDKRRRSKSRERHRERKDDKRRASHRRRHESTSEAEGSDRDRPKRNSYAEKQSRTLSHDEKTQPSNQDVSAPKIANKDSESDPSEAFVGPLPPPEAASKSPRGSYRKRTNLDAIFSPSYDPSKGVGSYEDPDDYSCQPKNEVRDLHYWKERADDRLRQGGVPEDRIQKWGENLCVFEGDPSDLKWNKQGEAREWDRGKVVDPRTGFVGFETGWVKAKEE